jgi:hypothetical protein
MLFNSGTNWIAGGDSSITATGGNGTTNGGNIAIQASNIDLLGNVTASTVTTPTTTGSLTIAGDQIAGGTVTIGSSTSNTRINGLIKTPAITSISTTGALTIGAEQIAGGTVTIGNTTNAVSINASTLNLGSANKTLILNAPIGANYSPSLIISKTQIGFKINGTLLAPVPPSTIPAHPTASNLYSAQLGPGTWLIQGNVKFNTPGAFLHLAIAGASGSFDFDAQITTAGISNSIAQVSRIVTVASGTPTYYLTGGCQLATVVENVRFNVYRIA